MAAVRRTSVPRTGSRESDRVFGLLQIFSRKHGGGFLQVVVVKDRVIVMWMA